MHSLTLKPVWLAIGMAWLVLIGGLSVARADSLSVTVSDDKGSPLQHAVVTLVPLFEGAALPEGGAVPEMRQQDTLFAPFVLPVRVGTSVTFPNLDEFRHHVYSFSEAKRFELRLYGRDETNAITFDQAGVVALGCNIHDNMLAYIYVTEAPLFQTSGADGRVAFEGLAAGNYELTVWHPGVRRNGAPEPERISVGAAPTERQVALRLRRVWGEQRPPAEGQY